MKRWTLIAGMGVVLCVCMAMQATAQPLYGPGRGPGVAGCYLQQILPSGCQLDADQVARLEELRRDFYADTLDLTNDLAAARNQLRVKLIDQETGAETDALRTRIVQLQNAYDSQRGVYQDSCRKVLTADQLAYIAADCSFGVPRGCGRGRGHHGRGGCRW